ncbi:alanine racemase [Tersicoccus solisilvae]|uniref:Alanine racemase n=1 Tax=Tersicoccus solisilvae TaxID=1882339 RepID=A0ABQ1NVB0_9MICC|nr:alanine racemase [Tersicoccus solisilvae]
MTGVTDRTETAGSPAPTPTDAAPAVDPRAAERSAVIDLAAIAHNVGALRARVAPAALMAVVKADAYGHGMLPVATAALDAGADWLGVAHVSEALTLRRAGIDAPVLAWLHTPGTDFAAAVGAGIDLGVSGWELEPIAAAAAAAGRTARVHLKIDTGLGRNGCTAEQWPGLVRAALEHEAAGRVRLVGVFSHLAVADEPDRPETDAQVAAFRAAVAVAEDAGARLEARHLANSPAILTRPDTHFDLVRAGVSLYGLSPLPGVTSADLGLAPAMTLRAAVANVKHVPAGQGVSYGLRYRTGAASALALVPLGYADGVPRIAADAPVLVGGHRHRVAGRIAMDQFVVDLVDPVPADPAALLGTDAVLFGDPATGAPAVEEWADAAQTINYEIVTHIGDRVPRVYRGDEAGR